MTCLKLRTPRPIVGADRTWTAPGLLAAGLVAATWLLPDSQLSVFALFVLYWIALLGVNLTFGCAGQFNLAQNTLYAAGAFGYAVAVVTLGTGAVVGVLSGLVVATVCAVAMSTIAARVSGLPLAVLTLGIALATPALLSSTQITGGFDGLSIPRPTLPLLGVPTDRQFLTVFALVGVAFFMMLRELVRTSWGVAFKSIGIDQEAAAALGIATVRYRTLVFALGGALVGAAGVMYSAFYGYVGYLSFTVTLVLLWYLGVVLGGSGSMWGPLMGALVVAVVPNRLPVPVDWQPVLWGTLLIAVLAVAPRGLAAAVSQRASRATGAAGQPLPESLVEQTDPINLPPRAVPGVVRPAQWAATPGPLQIEHINLEIGDFTILDDVSLELTPGQVHGLLGANGAGKSSLVNIVTGYLHPTGGKARLGDEVITGWSPARIRGAGVSRTFQHGRLMLEESTFANVLAGLHATVHPSFLGASLGLPTARKVAREQHDRVLATLEQFGIVDFAHERVEELPMGVRQLVSVGRAMIAEPQVLLLDEPIAGLNSDEVEPVMDAVTAVRDSGTAVLLIEHRLDFVKAVAEESTCLDAGKVIATGQTGDVLDSAAVRRAFLGETTEMRRQATQEVES